MVDKKNGLTPKELQFLAVLQKGAGTQTITEISRVMGWKESTVTQKLNALRKKFKDLGIKFPVKSPKRKDGGRMGPRVERISIDEALAQLASLGVAEQPAAE